MYLYSSISTLFYESFSYWNFQRFFFQSKYSFTFATLLAFIHPLHHTTVSNAMCECFSVSLCVCLITFGYFLWIHPIYHFSICAYRLFIAWIHTYSPIALDLCFSFYHLSSLPLFAYLLIYPKIAKNTFIIKLFLVSSNYKVSFVHCTAKTIELFVSINLNCYCAVYLTFSLPFSTRFLSSFCLDYTNLAIWTRFFQASLAIGLEMYNFNRFQ